MANKMKLLLQTAEAAKQINLKRAAILLRAEIGDFTLFRKTKQLAAFFGMDSSAGQSGKFAGTKTKISKRGSSYARAILDICVQSAVHPVKGKESADSILAAYYAEKIKTKEPKVDKTHCYAQAGKHRICDQELYQHAGQILYIVKRGGRDGYSFSGQQQEGRPDISQTQLKIPGSQTAPELPASPGS